MVRVLLDPSFEKTFSKIKDNVLKEKIIKQIEKIRDDPEIGKPMKYSRKGTRELYISPFRLAYLYLKAVDVDKVIILDFY